MKKKYIIRVLTFILLTALTALLIFTAGCRAEDNNGGDLNTPQPPGNGTGVSPVAPGFDVDYEGYILLAHIFEPDPTVPAESPQLPDRSYFRPADGEFRDISSLTAWDNNEQVLIGTSGAAVGAPILFSSDSLTSNNWISAQTAGIFNATGFRITFSTLGYENIRFTAHQKVSGDFGSGTDALVPFEMAFSTSGGVRWTAIHDSAVDVGSGDSFDSINDEASRVYDNFPIPGVVNNDEEVLLRIYLNTISNIPASGSISINNIKIIGDAIGGGATDVVLLELIEEDVNAQALFSATPEDAFYGATDGLADSDFRLTGWDRGRPRFIGYTGAVQTPIAFENIMTTRGWTAADGDIDNATAFQIQLRTLGFEDLVFSARQISSIDGPDVFKLAYSLDGATWSAIADSMRIVPQSSESDNVYLPLSYSKFELPSEMSSKESVFLRIYFDGAATGESTSINNIELWGREIVSYVGFSAEFLTLQPGKTSSEINITWHDWTMAGAYGKVMYEPAATASNGFSNAAQVADAAGADSYIRKTSHMATLTDLQPDTEYIYAVSSNGEDFSESYTFRTSPDDAFTFIAISDIHMGDPSVSPEDDDSGNSGMLDERYRQGVTAKQGWSDALDVITTTVPNAGFIAIMGDMVDRNLIDMESEPALHPHKIKWENFFTPKQLYNIPLAPVMGNHEARSNISFQIHFNVPNEIVPSPSEMLPMASTGIQQENENRANYWYLYNNALFVVLNTSTRPRDANENETQDMIIQGLIAHYDDVLKKAKAAHEGEYDWLIVQTHKSITGIAKHSADFDVERYVKQGFEALLVRHEVDLLLSAHEHCYTRSFPVIPNTGPDNFGPEIPRGDFRMNNVSFDFENDGNSIQKGEGMIMLTMSTISGQKFYSAYAPEFFNNSNYPYLFDGTRGALNMSLPPGDNVFLSANIETFGPRMPWSIAFYRQEYKPIFLELVVTADSIDMTAYEFAHGADSTLLSINAVDSFTIVKP